jgi:hypothetical protein
MGLTRPLSGLQRRSTTIPARACTKIDGYNCAARSRMPLVEVVALTEGIGMKAIAIAALLTLLQ